MKYLPKNTLAYYQSAPQSKVCDLSSVSVRDMGKATAKYRHTCGLVHPEVDAIRFYALNHCASIVAKKFTKNEALPDWAISVMDAYLTALVAQSERVGHYIISITTREARHTHTMSVKLTKEIDKISPVMTEFLKMIRGSNESAAVQSYMDNAPHISALAYMKAIEWVFDNGKYSGGYGGPPWGNIARTLRTCLQGQTSLEMMVDTSYTLAHNGGPMFNKGMMYNTQNNGILWLILDLQRAGQIPEMLIDQVDWSSSYRNHVADIIPIVNLVKENCPSEFGEWVNWNNVVGVHSSYNTQKAQQNKLHPIPVVTLFAGKPAVKTGEFEIWPGQSLTTFKREKAA